MEVHVLPPSPAAHFTSTSTSTTTTPYATAPSSPQSTIPFTWEQKPGIPKHQTDSDFAFGFLERHSISAADELFDGGKIKPLKPPPRLHHSNDSPKSPKSPKLTVVEALSPRKKKGFDHFDPFSEALKQTCGDHDHDQTQVDENDNDPQRGRERLTKNNRCKVSRSLSPFRVADIVNNKKNAKDRSSLTWYNKWNLKNLLLFRSASEGSAITRKKNQFFSFRSDREVATEDASVPYKSGLMGCLRFNQNAGSVREISRGIDSVMKQ